MGWGGSHGGGRGLVTSVFVPEESFPPFHINHLKYLGLKIPLLVSNQKQLPFFQSWNFDESIY